MDGKNFSSQGHKMRWLTRPHLWAWLQNLSRLDEGQGFNGIPIFPQSMLSERPSKFSKFDHFSPFFPKKFDVPQTRAASTYTTPSEKLSKISFVARGQGFKIRPVWGRWPPGLPCTGRPKLGNFAKNSTRNFTFWSIISDLGGISKN